MGLIIKRELLVLEDPDRKTCSSSNVHDGVVRRLFKDSVRGVFIEGSVQVRPDKGAVVVMSIDGKDEDEVRIPHEFSDCDSFPSELREKVSAHIVERIMASPSYQDPLG